MRTPLYAIASLLGFILQLLVISPAAGGETITYTYDTMGQVTKVEYADGTTITHTYDKMGNRQSRVIAVAGGGAPTVTTDSASGVTATGATLNGTVNANNHDTTVTFEYGLTTAYGTSVSASQNPVTGTTATAVSRAITGLTPGTVYHYRAIAVNSAGSASGSDRTFTTASGGNLPAVTTGSATGVTTTGATLNGTVNANNNTTVVTFEYGPTTAYGAIVAASQNPVTGSVPTAVSGAVTGLSPATLYHFRAVAVSALGTATGSDSTFTTTGGGAGSLSINNGAAYAVIPKVTLTIGTMPLATKMQLNYTVKGWGKVETFAPSKIISLPKGDGAKSVSVRYLADDGTPLGESSASIILDTKSPVGTMMINNRDKYTKSRDVTLAITASDITSGLASLCIREDRVPCGAGEFTPFVATTTHSLKSPGDGKKTVYVILKDLAGKTSKPLKGSITLDTIPPTGSILINNDAAVTTNPLVKLKIKGVKAATMQLSLDSGATWGAWEKLVSSKQVTLPAGAGEKTVKVRFKDLAGNESTEYGDSITLQ